jgi:hypothetical protein
MSAIPAGYAAPLGERVAEAADDDHAYRSGSAGFLVDTGTVLADGFVIRAAP